MCLLSNTLHTVFLSLSVSPCSEQHTPMMLLNNRSVKCEWMNVGNTTEQMISDVDSGIFVRVWPPPCIVQTNSVCIGYARTYGHVDPMAFHLPRCFNCSLRPGLLRQLLHFKRNRCWCFLFCFFICYCCSNPILVDRIKYISIAAGIVAVYMYYSVLQEQLTKTKYDVDANAEDNKTKGDTFEFEVTLLGLQFLVFWIVARGNFR